MDPTSVSSFFDEVSKIAADQAVLKNPELHSQYGRQLLQGQDVEKEHTDTIKWLKHNPDAPVTAATRSIASDHLGEDPKYYTHLKEMEDKYKEGMARVLKIAMSAETLKSLKDLPGISKAKVTAAYLRQKPPPIPSAARRLLPTGKVVGGGGHEIMPGVHIGRM